MKKILAMLLAGMMVMSLAACGGNGGDTGSNSQADATNNAPADSGTSTPADSGSGDGNYHIEIGRASGRERVSASV